VVTVAALIHINMEMGTRETIPNHRTMSLRMSHAPLTDKYLHALRATASGEVFRTYNSTAFTITGPCSSRLLWSLARMDLIADPPGGPLRGRHCMVLTVKGVAALQAAMICKTALQQPC
jgi:hypothetical protein